MQFCSSDGWGLFDVNGPNSITPCGASIKLRSQAKVPSCSLKVCKTQPAAIASCGKCQSISSTASGRGPPARRSPFAKLPSTALVYKSAHRQGETHLKASQHLESSCWPACYTLRSTGPVGTQIGRDKVRKRREDRDLQKSWLDAHRFVLPSTVLPGLPFSALAARAGYCPREAPDSAL